MPAIQEIDELNALLQRAQARLAKAPCLQKVWIKVDGDLCIGMVRQSLGWRLCSGYSASEKEPSDWRPVSELSVLGRIEAAHHVMKLLPEIEKQNSATLARVREAANHLKSVLSEE